MNTNHIFEFFKKYGPMYLRVSHIANATGFSEGYIRQEIKKGKIKAVRTNRIYYIEKNEAERFIYGIQETVKEEV